jgi:hypothetical protein
MLVQFGALRLTTKKHDTRSSVKAKLTLRLAQIIVLVQGHAHS